ncbi:SdrD B-like domain-containing protein [Runella rosea]|nr:SdrD B-like domain-containing protein [Runella rosea]
MKLSILSFSKNTAYFAILFCLFVGVAQSQVVLTLDYKEKNNLTTIQSGDKYTLQLDYSVSSTTGNASNVKAVINLPDNIYTVGEFVGTTHAPVANFVFTNTVGAKKLTINFINPVPSGSTGVLEFIVRTNNLTTPNNTQLCTTAEITDGTGATSGVKNHCMTVTAVPRICAQKFLLNGGAINNISTYQVRVSANGGAYPVNTPLGTLQATNITITDTLPANAEFISAKVYNGANGAEVGTGTYSAGVVTASIPNLTLRQYNNGTWESFFYNLNIQVKFNSPTFQASDVVTNTATVAYTPFTGTSSVLSDGDNVGGCVTDLIETTTLAEPVTSAVLTKTAGSNPNAYPGQRFSYTWSFTNTGNTPLENVEIIETIPANITIDQDAEYNGVRVLEWEDVDHIEYQTNVSGSTWVVLADGSGVPDLPSGTLFTKLKFVLRTPFPPGASLSPNNHILHFKALTEVTTTETVTNCMEWTSTTVGIPNQAGRTTCNSSVKLLPRPTTSKAIYNAGHLSNCSQVMGGTVTFTGLVIADVGYADGTNPVCALLIPAGFTYVPGSETFIANNSGITTPPTLEIIPNYITTGGLLRDLYRWTFPSGTILPYGERFSVNVTVKISPAVPPGSYNADFIATFSNASVSEPDYNFGNFVDSQDWDLDGNTTELTGRSNTNYGQCDINVAASASMESIKWVKGQLDTDYSRYPESGNTVRGGKADYRLVVKNTGNVPMKNIAIVDIMPFIGDKGVIDLSSRNTEWRPNLADTITAPAGITVFYSTTGNPCRDEMKAAADPSPFPTGCTPPNWSDTPPVDITTVQSVKLDFGSLVLVGGDSLEFTWPMRAPVDAPINGEIAWNSFGFVATRTDNNQPLLAAEPIKVGIKLAAPAPAYYGDYVWYDTNHDGIQDTGEQGVDGVKVILYKDNGDNITNPATDTEIAFTITGNGGKYLFPNLEPGNYYALFFPPAGYLVSPLNQGGDDAKDSDGTVTSYQGASAYVTSITQLDALEEDLTWDLGIYCNFTPTASSNSPVTIGDTLTLFASGGSSYSWTGPNGFTSAIANPTKLNVTLADTGIYKVTVAEGGCYASLLVNVLIQNCIKPLAAVTTKSQTICVGATPTAYTASPSTGVEYKWYGPLADTTSSLRTAISGQTTSSYTPTGAALTIAGTKYYAVVVNTTGDITCADTAFVQLVVNAKPSIADGSATICAGESVNLTAQITNYAIYLNPVWTVATANGTTVATPTVVKPTATTTYVLVAENAAGCKDTANVVVTVTPKPNAGVDTTLACGVAAPSTVDLVDALAGQKWKVLQVQPGTTVSITTPAGLVTGMTAPGQYQFLLQNQSDSLVCRDTVNVIVPDCNCPTINVLTPNATVCKDSLWPTLSVSLTGSNTAGVSVQWFGQAIGGTPLSTGLSFTPSGTAMATDTFYVALSGAPSNCSGLARIPVIITVKNCIVEVDLALTKAINKKIAQLGDTLTYTIKVFNQSSTGASGVEVTDSIATTVEFIAGSFTTTRGTASIVDNVIKWNIGNIAANSGIDGDTVTLTYKIKVTQTGLHFNTAEISKTNEKDIDSTPNNGQDSEDDLDRQCFTVPLQLCTSEKVQASIPANYANVQWFKNGSSTPIASGNVVLLSEPGTYTFTANNHTCPAGGCCPIIIQEGSNCCPVQICVPFTVKKLKK